MRCHGAQRLACASTLWERRRSRRLRNGTRSGATTWFRTMVFMTFALPPNSGKSYYYDYLALMTVDHPVGTEIFVDERFVIPPAKLAITTVSTPHKIARAVDDNGQDVTAIVSALDGHYLDTFGRGQYQGVTRDHYVEVDLGDDARQRGPLYLILQGWMHPTRFVDQCSHQPGRALARPTG